jgi:hypothetical protein
VSSTVKTSACVDCATPIIGDRLRCPACHADHAVTVASAPLSTPVDRPSFSRGLLTWVVFIEILAVVACGLWLATKGCAP